MCKLCKDTMFMDALWIYRLHDAASMLGFGGGRGFDVEDVHVGALL